MRDPLLQRRLVKERSRTQAKHSNTTGNRENEGTEEDTYFKYPEVFFAVGLEPGGVLVQAFVETVIAFGVATEPVLFLDAV